MKYKAIVKTKKKKQKVATKFAKALIKKSTPAEVRFRKLLKDANIVAKQSKIINTKTSFYIIDFYIKPHKLCIEIDGEYHCITGKWIYHLHELQNVYFGWKLKELEIK